MFGKAQTKNSNIWKSEIREIQCMEKPNKEFQCFEKRKSRIPMLRKPQILRFSQNSTIPMFVKAKVKNSNVWKSRNRKFHCFEKPKSCLE